MDMQSKKLVFKELENIKNHQKNNITTDIEKYTRKNQQQINDTEEQISKPSKLAVRNH